MECFQGKSVFGGIAIGKISVYKKEEKQVEPVKIEDASKETARFRKAKAAAIRELQKLYGKVLREAGETEAAIFKAHQLLVEDVDYNEAVEQIIRSRHVNAEYAVAAAGEKFSRMFAEMENDYLRERAADLKDVSKLLIACLSGRALSSLRTDEPVIVAAEDFGPSELVQLDKDKVSAFVTARGSLYSHTAILAGTMGIPALIGTSLPLDETVDGKQGIVDGADGILYVEPDPETLAELTLRRQREQETRSLLLSLKGRENITLDGRKIMLHANIGNIGDLKAVKQNDAGGIGLFRSEFIYLERDSYPTEEEQFQIYRQAVKAMEGKPVVIRTLDLGADKQCGYFDMDREENPALGCRGIRLCLTRWEIFKTQLRALLRASAFGNLAILYPMITCVDEVRQIREMAALAKQELREQGLAYGHPKEGVMIETPAAALISDTLAGEVDFFSIGTNDLTQYTLAMDRQNPKLEAFYNPYHPAVLRLISLVVENAHKAGIRVGICGELGADTGLTREFLAMGVDELSVSAERILPIRKIILETNVEQYRDERKHILP